MQSGGAKEHQMKTNPYRRCIILVIGSVMRVESDEFELFELRIHYFQRYKEEHLMLICWNKGVGKFVHWLNDRTGGPVDHQFYRYSLVNRITRMYQTQQGPQITPSLPKAEPHSIAAAGTWKNSQNSQRVWKVYHTGLRE